MTFTSYQFILGFLPLAFIGFALANRFGGVKMAMNFLALASLVFYGMFGVKLLAVLLASLVFNFLAGGVIARALPDAKKARPLMIGAVAANLLLLGYLKYTNFLIDVANQVTGAGITHVNLLVPLGVSFFTFVQIGYLLDAYNGQLKKHDFGRYIVFSAFFPCVTAGPLVLQKEMMEQLDRSYIKAFDATRLMIGLTMFAMGLFKKVMLADSIAPFADKVFNGVQAGGGIDMATAWIGSLCYTLQLYFDFSGYSDMAIGIATIFAIRLPLNFDSPFKSTNISDFWRRWHMTMTRFFTNYVYSGLAMNGMRKSASLRLGGVGRFLLVAAIPSIVTFLVAGVWHGSGWTFVIYGLMHGIAIAAYLGWREFSSVELSKPVAWLLTMLTVVCALVMFRAADVPTALTILGHMWGMGASAGDAPPVIIDVARALSMIVILGAVTLLLPNTQQILHHEWPVVDTKPDTVAMDAGLVAWRPSFSTAFVTAGVFTISITSIGTASGFLYYQF
jgi:alginate O-acetyltransferase complex protein AlgI